jgi:hypothetical protein
MSGDWNAVGGYLQNAMDKIALENLEHGQKTQTNPNR